MRATGLVAASLAGLALIGWATDQAQLASLVAGWTPMKAASAVLLGALGLALAMPGEDAGAPRSRWVVLLAAFVVAWSGVTLAEYLLRTDGGIERVLFPDSPLRSGPFAGRMSLARVVAFLCAAVGLLALGRSWRGMPVSEWLGLACAAIGGLGLMGILFAEPALSELGTGVPVAFPTSVGLTFVGVGVMLAPGTAHRMPAVLGDPGPAGIVARRIIPAAIVLLPLIGAASHLAERAGLLSGTMADVATVLIYVAALLGLGSWAANGAVRLDNARQRASLALAASEQRFRAVVEQSPDGVVVFDAHDLRIRDSNPAAAAMLGRSSLVGVSVTDLAADPGALASGRAAAWPAGASLRGDVALRRSDGSTFEAETVSKVLPGGQILTTIRDVTERAAAEAERRRLTAAVEQSTDALTVIASDGTILYVNAAFEAASGFERGDLLGRFTSIFRTSSPDASVDASPEPPWASIVGGASWTGAITATRKDGSPWTAEWSIAPVRDEAGAPAGHVAVARDRSAERALEDRLRQAEKMEAVGQLAGGIAHDFNNLLTAIRGYAELLVEQLPADAPARADADEVIDAADRATGLTRQLLAFSRRQVLAPRILDPAAVVTGVVPLLRRLLGEDVDVRVDAIEGAGPVRVDPSQLEQVVVNLAVNARDAMPEGGILAITVADVELAASDLVRHPEIQPGPYVLLEMSDTGEGMDPETQARAFEPFFTTKAVGKGTGMGLATVYGIVKQSSGYVYFTSDVGRGTTFRVYLPRVGDVEAAPGHAGEEAAAVTPLAAGKTVLLVEDERVVREFARRVLEDLGYRVLTAGDGAEALDRLRDHRDAVDLLVTDIVMPGLGGRELARRATEARPGLPVLFLSGYAPEHVTTPTTDESARLAKPFTRRALAQAVADALSDQPKR